MKKKYFLLILVMFLSGCATLDTVRSSNRENLMKLSIGMTKQDVLTTMGTKTIVTFDTLDGTTINNPYRSETLSGKDKTLEVLYYYTDCKQQDGAITDDELTPLVFEDEKLIGWGWSFLKDNVSKYEIRIR